MTTRGESSWPRSDTAPEHGGREQPATTTVKKSVKREKLDTNTTDRSNDGTSLPQGLVDKLTMLNVGGSSNSSKSSNSRGSSNTKIGKSGSTMAASGGDRRQVLGLNDATQAVSEGGSAGSMVKPAPFAQQRGFVSQQPTHKEQGPSLMEQMMAEAMAAREGKTKEEQKQRRERAKKKFAGGLKRGFLGGGSQPAATRNRKANREATDGTGAAGAQPAKPDDIPIISGSKQASDSGGGLEFDVSAPVGGGRTAGLVLPEVQDAMNQANRQPALGDSSGNAQGGLGTDWLTPELLDKISQKPRLSAMLMDPRFAQAMQCMSTNPQQAKAMFASSPEAQETFLELTALLAEHFTSMGQEADARAAAEEAERRKVSDGPLAQEALRKAAAGVGMAATTAPSPEEKARVEEVLGRPELRELLVDPGMQRVLQECGEPSNLARYMRHPEFGPKLQLMAKAGLVSFQS